MKNNKIKKFFGRTLSVILMVFLLVGTIPLLELVLLKMKWNTNTS